MNLNSLIVAESREPYQQAIDKLEQRRIEDLEMKMDDLARRAQEALMGGDEEYAEVLRSQFNKAKAERDSYYGVREDSMASAEQHPQGPEFTGYWKGTDSATPGTKMVGNESKEYKTTPRNFVAKNMKQSGQGKHKDMKRAMKQGDVKHKKDLVPVVEGAKVDRMVKHIAKSEREAGKSKKDAESIAWATVNKRGYLDNVNKKDVDEGVAGPQSCWTGYRKVGTKPGTGKNAGKRVNDCEKIKEDEIEEGIAGNMQVRSTPTNLRTPKVKQISKAGLGKHNNALKKARAKAVHENFIQWAINEGYSNLTSSPIVYEQARLAYKLNENLMKASTEQLQAIWNSHKDEERPSPALAMKLKAVARELQRRRAVKEDWQKANKKDKTDGMSKKAVKAYRRENPGSKLQTAVTTKPSKLKKGSKASKRRKSYCSRSKGQMKMHNVSCQKTPDKPICKARRRWNCESQEQFDAMLTEAISKDSLKPGQYYVWTVYFDDGSEKRIKVTKDTFDPKAYYAKQNKNVINVDYSWTPHNG